MYRVKANCPGCGACEAACPVNAIKVGTSAVISNGCISCGICVPACPVKLIEKVPEGTPSSVKTAGDAPKKSRKKEADVNG